MEGAAAGRSGGNGEAHQAAIGMVAPGQVAAADISTKSGAVVITKGTVLSAPMVMRLRDMVAVGAIAASLPLSTVGVQA
jgi:hypothetical protein